MSLLEKKLATLAGQEIVVVMADNRAFRGKLVEFDDTTIVLNNAYEALPTSSAGWEEPTASTAMVHKVVTWQGVFSHEDTHGEVVKLKDVMIRVSGVLRIWEWSLSNTSKPEHVEVSDASEPRPGQRVTRRN